MKKGRSKVPRARCRARCLSPCEDVSDSTAVCYGAACHFGDFPHGFRPVPTPANPCPAAGAARRSLPGDKQTAPLQAESLSETLPAISSRFESNLRRR